MKLPLFIICVVLLAIPLIYADLAGVSRDGWLGGALVALLFPLDARFQHTLTPAPEAP